MESFIMKGDARTPIVNFDYKKGHLEMAGRAVPEDAYDVFKPIMRWIDEYTHKPNPSGTELVLKLDFFNTSSSAFIVNILKAFDRLYKKGHDIKIKWYYEEHDEDMKEYGEDYQSLLSSVEMDILQL